ncbi:universal stress protein [Actinosynnema sp. NPDC023587]|uniref:universal stress protein n=1 Tax=Actinosynnema sp. NPDC023587 TaxID=3154695 RepID=UPI0033EFFE9C
MKAHDTNPIVVGIDGSPAADHALRWALDEGIIRGCPVHVVNAWDYEPLADWSQTAAKTALTRSKALVEESLRAAAVWRLDSPVIVRRSLRGDAPSVLADAARGSALLVVGSHAGHPVRDLVLGSTSTQCLLHASVPVVMIPVKAAHATPALDVDHAADHG